MVNTSQYIIEKIAPVFNKQGYVGTSLSDLTKVTNLTKGALYCNFKNKEELALKSFRHNLKKAILPLYSNLKKQKSSIDKLYALTNYYRNYYELGKDIGGCPILNVGIDTKYNNAILFEEVRKETKKIIYGLSIIIQNGIDNNEIMNNIDPVSCAGNIYSMIDGAIFLSFTQDNKEYLDSILEYIDTFIIKSIKT